MWAGALGVARSQAEGGAGEARKEENEVEVSNEEENAGGGRCPPGLAPPTETLPISGKEWL